MTNFLRHWRALAITGLVILPSLLLTASALFDPRDLMTDGGGEGPYAVRDGVVTAERIDAVAAGDVIGWRSTLCLKPGADMLARVEFRTAGGRIVEARTRRWMPGQRACGPLPGMLRIVAETPPGAYALCRAGVLRPDGWWPLHVDLGCLAVSVTAARE